MVTLKSRFRVTHFKTQVRGKGRKVEGVLGCLLGGEVEHEGATLFKAIDREGEGGGLVISLCSS